VPQLAARVHDGSLDRGRDRVPWSTGIYSENSIAVRFGRGALERKLLILWDTRRQIPYATEQGNKSGEQGDKIGDQGIKSPEHGTRV
jgi:hypothetical protein